MNWLSDKKGNHFNDSKKPGIHSTENSSPGNGSQTSSIQQSTHRKPEKFFKEGQVAYWSLIRKTVLIKENQKGNMIHIQELTGTKENYHMYVSELEPIQLKNISVNKNLDEATGLLFDRNGTITELTEVNNKIRKSTGHDVFTKGLGKNEMLLQIGLIRRSVIG